MSLTEFYPTPEKLIDRMLAGINLDSINAVLEPSAGKGDLVKAMNDKFHADWRYSGRVARTDFIDCVEIDPNLRLILKGSDEDSGKHQGYRVVHDDFLTYYTRKKYDLIVMNPPFSSGDKHLMKAIEIMEYGGQIVCVLNAETLRNPYSNLRKELVRRLEELNADIEYIESAFTSAERTTEVEVALIKVTIPATCPVSLIIDNLEKAKEAERIQADAPNAVVSSDFITAIVERYKFEIEAGVRLIKEYMALYPYIQNSINNSYKSPVLKLVLTNEKSDDLINGYIRSIRSKYWSSLFESKEFVRNLTTNLQTELFNRVNALEDYEFSVVNILTIKAELSRSTVKSIEDTILKLFDDLSGKHAYSDAIENGNVHYYNGWRSNKAWKINKKVVIPFYGAFNSSSGKFEAKYDVAQKLGDIEKCLDFLDAGRTKGQDMGSRLECAQNNQQSRSIELKYFDVTFFKKGTCHISFTNSDLLDKLNLFASQRRGWLPPGYGKKAYKEMEPEEKKVIDTFEGEKSYARVMANPDYFIVPPTGVSLLGAFEAAAS